MAQSIPSQGFKNLKNFMNISEKIELKKACSTI